MRNNRKDAVIYRYMEFLKELYIDCQYIEPINMTNLIAKHQISGDAKTEVKNIGIIQQVQINGKYLKGRYTWLVDEPSVEMAIALIEAVRIRRYNGAEIKLSGYWQTTSYLFGLIKIKKWIETN